MVEVEVENITKHFLCLSSVVFVPANGLELIKDGKKEERDFAKEDLNTILDNEEGIYSQPGSISQFVFKLKLPSSGSFIDGGGYGRLEIEWNRNMCQKGTFLSNPILEKAKYFPFQTPNSFSDVLFLGYTKEESGI